MESTDPGGDPQPFKSPKNDIQAREDSLTTQESNKMNDEATTTRQNSESDMMNMSPVSWKGWAELENDPVSTFFFSNPADPLTQQQIIFTTILRAWGVKGVQVGEVIPLDTILERDPYFFSVLHAEYTNLDNRSSVLGLIFLSRWVPSDTTDETRECPENLWFANQISTFSCATLALMNIVNNQANINLGPELQRFKQETSSMSPKAKGLQLDGFQFVKDIHNSFSRELDRMIVDLRLKDEVQASARRSRKSRKKFTKRKKTRHSDDDDENGFHFVAYVPAQEHVWRLDGMESYPRDMGPIEPDGTWLVKIIADLQIILEASEADGTEFSLLSLDLETSEHEVEESKISRMKEDWSPFIAHMLRLHAEKGDLDSLLG